MTSQINNQSNLTRARTSFSRRNKDLISNTAITHTFIRFISCLALVGSFTMLGCSKASLVNAGDTSALAKAVPGIVVVSGGGTFKVNGITAIVSVGQPVSLPPTVKQSTPNATVVGNILGTIHRVGAQ